MLSVAIAYRSAPRFELLGDAVFLVRENSQMRAWSWLPHQLWSDYFASDSGATIGYWRPLTKASWLVETMLGGGSEGVYAVVSAAWLAVCALGAFALAARLGAGRWAASLAASVFAVHPALYEPTCLAMARSDVVCCAGVVWALVAWRGIRDASGRGGAWWALFVAAQALAFGSKETALVMVPLLAVWSFAESDLRRGLRGWAPLLVTVGIAVVHGVLRGLVVEDASADMTLDPDRILSGVALYTRGAFPFALESGIRNLSLPEAASAGWMAAGGAVVVSLTVGVLWAWRRGGASVVGLLAWYGGALAPVLLPSSVNTPSAYGTVHAYADRWVMQSVLAACVLGALALAKVPQRWRVPVLALLGAWCLAAAALGPVAHAPYETPLGQLALEDRDYEAAPERFRTLGQTCRYTERAFHRAIAGPGDGVTEAMAIGAQRAAMGCPASGDMDLTLLNGLVARERWAEAAQVAARMPLTDGWREQGRAALLVGNARIRVGDFAGAVSALEVAQRTPATRCRALLLEGQAHGMAGSPRRAADRLERGYDCARASGEPVPDVLRHAARAAWQAGDPFNAVRLVTRPR